MTISFNMDKKSPIFNSKTAIPEQNVNNDGLLEVIVAEIFSPDNFYIQLKGDSTSQSLEILMDSMEEFYDNRGDDYKVRDSSFVEGFVCASQFNDGNWYRARVSSVDMAGVQVFYVDYGTTTVVQCDSLRYLLHQFSHLPCQALKAKLAGVKPPSEQEEWPVEASNRFLQLVSGPSEGGGVLADVRSVGRELSLWLVDTVTNDLENGIQINQELVNEGFAMVADGSNSQTLGSQEGEESVIEVSEEAITLEERHGEERLVNVRQTRDLVDKRQVVGASNSVQKLVNEMRSRLSVNTKSGNIHQLSEQVKVEAVKGVNTVKDDKDQHCINETASKENPRYSVTTSRPLLKNVIGAPPIRMKTVLENYRNSGENTTENNLNKSGTIVITNVLQKYDTGAAIDDTEQYPGKKATGEVNKSTTTTSRATLTVRKQESSLHEVAQHLGKKDSKEDYSSGKISTARAMYRNPIRSIRHPLRRPFDSSTPRLSNYFSSSSSLTSTSSESSFGGEDSSPNDKTSMATESPLEASTPLRGQQPSRSNLLEALNNY